MGIKQELETIKKNLSASLTNINTELKNKGVEEVANIVNVHKQIAKIETSAELSEELDGVISNIETLVGAPPEIATLTIHYYTADKTYREITYEVGMTWEEWCNSDYNALVNANLFCQDGYVWNYYNVLAIVALDSDGSTYKVQSGVAIDSAETYILKPI